MKYRTLGSTGLQVSALSFGSYLTFGHSVDVNMASKLMKIAYDAEINLFDNAEVYASGRAEEIMGEALKQLKWPRDSYILMTKVFWGGPKPTQLGLNRKHIYECCNAALKRLNVEYIDLFLCHRPDRKTPIEETVRAMHNLILQGKILYWGTSEWSSVDIMEVMLIAEKYNLTAPSVEQFRYNMLERQKGEKDLLPLILKKSLGTTITMPLAGGLLTGKYNDYSNNDIPADSRYYRFQNILGSFFPLETVAKVKKLTGIASSVNMSMTQLAITWCLKNNNISSIIVGASNEEQLKENLKSISLSECLNEEIMKNIDDILENKPVIFEEGDLYNYNQIIETT